MPPGSVHMTSSNAGWLFELLGIDPLDDGDEAIVAGETVELARGVVRVKSVLSNTQSQTADPFGFKWSRRDTFESQAMRRRVRAWLVERYGDLEHASWWSEYGERPIVLDAGCGA